MGRQLDVDQLMSATEIAVRCTELGIIGSGKRQIVHTWASRYSDFPPPVATLSRMAIWYWPDVQAWLDQAGMLDRGPNSTT